MSTERYFILQITTPIIKRYKGYRTDYMEVLAVDESGDIRKVSMYSDEDGDLSKYTIGEWFVR